jgi:hypothetical protein
MIEELKQALTRKGISNFLFLFAMLEMPNLTTWFIIPLQRYMTRDHLPPSSQPCDVTVEDLFYKVRRSSDENLRTIALNIRLSVFEGKNNVGKLQMRHIVPVIKRP